MAGDQFRRAYDEFVDVAEKALTWVRAWWSSQPPGSWIQILMLAVVFAYVVFTYRLMKTAHGTLRTATQQLEATDRPWISVDVQLTGPPRVNAEMVNLVAVATLKNHGRAVATNVRVEAFAYPQRFSNDVFTAPIHQQSERCRAVREQPIVPSQSSITLFPEETVSLPFAAAMGRLSIDAAAIDSEPRVPTRIVLFMLVGCVDYTFPNSEKHHQTGFIYQVTRENPQTSIDPADLYAGKLASEQFGLVKFFHGGLYVD